MWKRVLEIFVPIGPPINPDPIWSMSAEEARIAPEEAVIWRNLFWVAVIVIAVLVFIIWKKHRITVEETAKEPEEL